MSKLFVLLNDGETFTNIEGCQVVMTPDDWEGDDLREAIENGTAFAHPLDEIVQRAWK